MKGQHKGSLGVEETVLFLDCSDDYKAMYLKLTEHCI